MLMILYICTERWCYTFDEKHLKKIIYIEFSFSYFNNINSNINRINNISTLYNFSVLSIFFTLFHLLVWSNFRAPMVMHFADSQIIMKHLR